MEIAPFRALRYDPARVPVADVVTQPYDKITPSMRERYYAASPFNLVRIVLGNPDIERPDVYQAAGEYFCEWREQGILKQDAEPSLYAYSQCFTMPGSPQTLERRGLIALGRLYDYSEGVVFRHEKTLAKPKQDRLNLLRLTRAQFEQLFMVYSDPQENIDAEVSTSSPPDIELQDEYGVEHRVWRVAQPETVARLVAFMRDKKVIIADGHHRYETAMDYRHERAAAEPGRIGAPYDYVVMTFVNMDAPGLVILPTHRVISGLPGFDKDLFLRSAFPYFTIEPASTMDPMRLVAQLHHAGQQGTAFVVVIGCEAFLLRARPGAADAVLAEVSPRQRALDLVHLHKVLLEHVMGISEEATREQRHISYVREAAEAIEQARSGANAAFLVNPVRMEQVRDVALAGEVMPQKSTDFYPKLLSGLTMYAME
jgi:uncharacterized protein (DUF1015 family)